jgi:hypothetical protein
MDMTNPGVQKPHCDPCLLSKTQKHLSSVSINARRPPPPPPLRVTRAHK